MIYNVIYVDTKSKWKAHRENYAGGANVKAGTPQVAVDAFRKLFKGMGYRVTQVDAPTPGTPNIAGIPFHAWEEVDGWK